MAKISPGLLTVLSIVLGTAVPAGAAVCEEYEGVYCGAECSWHAGYWFCMFESDRCCWDTPPWYGNCGEASECDACSCDEGVVGGF